MMKRRETVWFWLIAISLMVFAMCVLSLQIIELHQDSDLKRYRAQQVEKLELKTPEEPAVEPSTPPATPVEKQTAEPVPVPSGPIVVLSKPLRTPKVLRSYDRSLYDVPAEANGGFWALLRGLHPEDKLIRSEWIAKLKRKAAKRALAMEPGPSESEVRRMFGEETPLDTAMLPYLAQAMGQAVIVSDNQGHGYDLFLDDGETEHYDQIEDLTKYAENPQTVWLHNLDNAHWTVAVANAHDDPTPEDVYFLTTPPASESDDEE
ncbi:MAG: hypothetical protein K2L24_02860 [Opitutales bacterium]|nr:hypothetical protein [Opitutales bacterium]